MQLISYSPYRTCSLASHSSCITLAAQEELGIAQLALPLSSSSLSSLPPNVRLYTVPCSVSSHIYLHAHVLPMSSYTLSSVECVIPIGASSGNRNCRSFVRFVLSARGGHVASQRECEMGLHLMSSLKTSSRRAWNGITALLCASNQIIVAMALSVAFNFILHDRHERPERVKVSGMGMLNTTPQSSTQPTFPYRRIRCIGLATSKAAG